jgi:hypothetical protein
MSIIIDPPVSPFSEPERIRAWISELERLRVSRDLSPSELADVDRALVQAINMLDLSPTVDHAEERARDARHRIAPQSPSAEDSTFGAAKRA